MHEIYNDEFYKKRDKMTRHSAKVILSEVLKYYFPKTVIDIGCGVGTWLDVFRSIVPGERQIVGIDGAYVDNRYLVIPQNNFYAANLEEPLPVFDNRFDLAISLEVAEHLEPDRAESFIKDLCAYSDVVLFSAATILQGGNGHKNEQRLSYWVNIFNQQGYECYDVIRKEICNDVEIPDWYRNNVVFFAKKGCLNIECDNQVMDYIVPDMYERKARELIDIQEQYERLKKQYEAAIFVRNFFETLAEIDCKQNFLVKRISNLGYRNIALYGFGKVGRLIWRHLKDSENVKVMYIIDHYLKSLEEVSIFDYTDKLSHVDAVIITPILQIAAIKETLRGILDSDIDIIGIDELVGLS